MNIELIENYSFEEYRSLFYRILDEKKLYKTSERFHILRAIYDTDGHFTVDTLYNKLKSKKYQVSKTTIYNTLSLLESFYLIEKHNFGGSCAQYEKCDTSTSHDHIIIIDTDEIIEFKNEKLNLLIKEIEDTYKLKVARRAFTLFCHKK
ncbi:MAG: Fur family transcriptional regulator [Bacteroidales bacterium]|jgi:Fur family ferric uptake transcriptional regulator